MALFNNFPYSNTEEINLDYTLNKLNELYSRGENLYAELQSWKTATDEANEAWKSDLLSDINEWQNSVTHSLEEWKISVDAEVTNALTTLSNQITTELNQAKADLRSEVADLASAAAASASDAAASQSSAAQSAQTALNSATAAAASAAEVEASAEQIETNKDDISDIKSAVDNNYIVSTLDIWSARTYAIATGLPATSQNRFGARISINNSVVSIVKAINDYTFCVYGWLNGVYQGVLDFTDGTFKKSWTNNKTNTFNLYDYPEYDFVILAIPPDDTITTFDNSTIQFWSNATQYKKWQNDGNKTVLWTQGGVSGNIGDTPTITSSSTNRQHIIIRGLTNVSKITMNSDYGVFPKIVDSTNNIIVQQLSNGNNDVVIPPKYRSDNYILYLVAYHFGAISDAITSIQAYNNIFIHVDTDTGTTSNLYEYYGDKISLNAHKFNIYQGINVATVSNKHKQGVAIYKDVLVQLYSDNLAKIINVQTGEEINTFTTTSGHGAGAQFSDEFLTPEDDYPLLYVSPEIDSSEIQVIHLTNDEWTVERIINVPYRSFAGIDNDAKKLVVITIDTTTWVKTINVYDMSREPTITDGKYNYTLIQSFPLPTFGVQQCCMMNDGLLYFLNSDTDGTPRTTWLCVIDPYSGRVRNIIKDFNFALMGNTSSSEVEGIAIYYNKVFEKNMMFVANASTSTWLLDFDVE